VGSAGSPALWGNSGIKIAGQRTLTSYQVGRATWALG
jgi:hypothetical protein